MPGVCRRIEFKTSHVDDRQSDGNQRRRGDNIEELEEEIARLSALSEELTLMLLRERIALAEGVKRALESWKEELEQLRSKEEVRDKETES